MLRSCPGKVSESLRSPGPSHSLPPAMRSKAAQSSRRAPARVMVPVADAPYSPGALLYLCLSSFQGDSVICFLSSGDSPDHSVNVPEAAQEELCVLARC